MKGIKVAHSAYENPYPIMALANCISTHVSGEIVGKFIIIRKESRYVCGSYIESSPTPIK